MLSKVERPEYGEFITANVLLIVDSLVTLCCSYGRRWGSGPLASRIRLAGGPACGARRIVAQDVT
jgi:hypothetical protein